MPDMTDVLCDFAKHQGYTDEQVRRLRRKLRLQYWVYAPLLALGVTALCVLLGMYWPAALALFR